MIDWLIDSKNQEKVQRGSFKLGVKDVSGRLTIKKENFK